MDVHEVINYYKLNGLNETLDYFNIDTIYKDLKGKTVESRLVIDFNGKATIFMQLNLNEKYQRFLKAHELGHYILHYQPGISFNYLTSVYKTTIEREANVFACKLLLSDTDLKSECEFIFREQGIPEKIWYSVAEKITKER